MGCCINGAPVSDVRMVEAGDFLMNMTDQHEHDDVFLLTKGHESGRINK